MLTAASTAQTAVTASTRAATPADRRDGGLTRRRAPRISRHGARRSSLFDGNEDRLAFSRRGPLIPLKKRLKGFSGRPAAQGEFMSVKPELRLYNTLSRKKERFEPIDRENVRVYACGPTVYDHLHIGNGRMLVVFDVLFRLLRHLYGPDHVTYVRNITDVDDRINARAAELGVYIRALTNEMIDIFHADAKALGCLPPTIEPRATDHIRPMLEIIGKLIARGHAYAAEGHVLFDVPSDKDYGKLSRRPLDEMIAGARVEVAPYKRAPTDFVLWKPSAPGEPAWDSPWGRGRPGWHLECSAMSWKHLGEIFDIHGGGIDLVFPHHENEIAQTCSAFGHDVMANYWMHNGHLQVQGEKMSKSLGNFVTIHELLHTDKFGSRSIGESSPPRLHRRRSLRAPSAEEHGAQSRESVATCAKGHAGQGSKTILPPRPPASIR